MSYVSGLYRTPGGETIEVKADMHPLAGVRVMWPDDFWTYVPADTFGTWGWLLVSSQRSGAPSPLSPADREDKRS